MTVDRVVHARSMVYVGHAHTGSSLSVGPRVYRERKLKDGQVELVCGLGLDDVHRAAVAADPGDTLWHYPWARLVSKKSREAKLVTCPECRRRLVAAGFKYATLAECARDSTA